MKIHSSLVTIYTCLLGLVILPAGSTVHAAPVTIENDTVWKDTEGNEILCQGGGIYQEEGVYYWVGTDPTFNVIRCYSSSDLKNWTFRGDLFTTEQSPGFVRGRSSVIRPTLLKNPISKKYVLIFFHGGGALPKIAFAESETLHGAKYTYKGSTLLDNCVPGDQSVFKCGNDAYIVATYDWNKKVGIFKLDPASYLEVESVVYRAFNSAGIEAPHIIQRDGKYLWFGSLLAGWHSSATQYGVASSLAGPWTFTNLPISPKPGDVDKLPYDYIVPVEDGGEITWVHHSILKSNNSYNSQHDFVLPVTGSGGTTYLYGGDRWSNYTHFGIGKYVWLPLSWDGDVPTLNCLKSWSIDTVMGNWTAAPSDQVASP